MAEPKTTPPDISPIRVLIRKTVRLLRSSWVATGMGLTLGLGLGTLVTLALLDLALPLDSWFRTIALVMVVVPAVWAFAAGVVRPLVRRLRPAQVARRIEGHIPGIHNRLVSCIDLDSSGKKDRYSPEFYKRLVQEALERIKGFRPGKVVDGRSLRRSLTFAATSVLAFGLAFGLFSDRMPTALARIFSPFADIPPASGVVYSVEPGDAKILRGEDVTFLVKVEKGEPDRLQLEMRPGAGKPLKHDLQKVEPGLWRFTLSGYEKTFDYRVRGGGTWTTRKRITMVDRPTITSLHTVLHFPEYMGLPDPRVGPPQVADVTGPVGSAVEVVVEARGDVAEGEVQLLKARPKQVAVLDRPERLWFQERLPDGVALKGTWNWDFRLLARPVHTQPTAADYQQHEFTGGPAFPVHASENLFAYVYLKPGALPEMIAVKWFDGSGWEHRAYWGADKLPNENVKPNTPGRRHLGPLPKAGEWVRLEVPAQLMDLEGKTVRGMSFGQIGGQCYWHRAGTLPPSHVEREELYVAEKFPVESAGQGLWAGRFPLKQNSLYRVELRNELGHPSKPMKPAKVTAIPDNPPQVVLERPGSDLILSEPAKVPLSIAAYDDFGLADIVVSVQRGDSGGFVGRPVKHYDHPKRSENVLASLDVPSFDLKPGEHVRYRVEARDRKGQSAQTQEYIVRIANDDKAADKQLESFEKGQDTFRENLVKLIAEQAKVQEAVKTMTAKYEPLEEKVKAAQEKAEAEARPAPEGKPKEAKAPEAPKLDPETAKQLEELRKELAQLAAKEEQNAKVAEQVEAGLKQAAEQAENLKMLPTAMLRQLQAVKDTFQERALEPLQDLAAEMKQGADPKQAPPDLAELQRDADRLQKELEAVKNQLEAGADARKELPKDAEAAVDQLRQEMLRENAALTARELQELMEFLKAREEEIKKLEGQQQDLADATPKAPEMILPDIEKRQEELDPKEDRALEDARALLDADKLRRMKREDPDFPAAPFQPEGNEEMVPPKEEDPAEPADADAKDAAKHEGEAAEKKDDAEKGEDEPLFLPALGGPKPKLDPRFADKLRPVPPKAAAKGDHPHDRRDELHAHQQERLGELDTARQALASDEHTLEALLRQLEQALNNDNAEEAQQLMNRLAQTPALRQALAMAQRSKHRPSAKAQARPHPHHPAVATNRPDEMPTTDQVGSTVAELADLDLATRTVILKMQPQLREELLQGLREEGPEGYKAFIRDYFKRLTQVKGAP